MTKEELLTEIEFHRNVNFNFDANRNLHLLDENTLTSILNFLNIAENENLPVDINKTATPDGRPSLDVWIPITDRIENIWEKIKEIGTQAGFEGGYIPSPRNGRIPKFVELQAEKEIYGRALETGELWKNRELLGETFVLQGYDMEELEERGMRFKERVDKIVGVEGDEKPPWTQPFARIWYEISTRLIRVIMVIFGIPVLIVAVFLLIMSPEEMVKYVKKARGMK